jgi:imidazole glycerol-phosphate synthase subunit HisH
VIGVIDFGAGNTRSVLRAFLANAASAQVVSRPENLRAYERLVLPGVGAAGSAMDSLRSQAMVDPIRQWVAEGRPFLGICLGAQLMLDASEEDSADGLGLLPGVCRRFPLPERGGPHKVPHIGWNRVRLSRGEGFDAYFVHSFWLDPVDAQAVAGWTDVDGFSFPSVIRRGSMLGTQFHPEKSGRAGRALLAAWAEGRLDAAAAQGPV